MNCYYCSTTMGPGGTHYGIRQAIGICRECGLGVCEAHGKLDELGTLHCAGHLESTVPIPMERIPQAV